MRNNKITILIVDDEIKIVRVLKDFLTASGYNTLSAYNGETAISTFYEHSSEIDLILLDIMMPIIDGIEVLNEIRKCSDVPVILLTAKGEEYDQEMGFKSGTDDYIVKPFSQSLLLLRIEALLKRLGKSTHGILQSGGITLDILKRDSRLFNQPMILTRREFDLLHYFLINKGLIITREQILNNVWGYEFEGDIRTIDTHIKQLREKLGVCASYLRTIYRIGYQFEVTNEETH